MAPTASMASSISQAVDATLAAHLDEDATEYVTSLLSDDPCDEDAREAVLALVSGSIDDEDADAAEVCAAFFQLLDFGSVGGPGDEDGDTNAAGGSLPKTPAPTRTSSTMSDTVGGGELRKLTESVDTWMDARGVGEACRRLLEGEASIDGKNFRARDAASLALAGV